MPQHPLDIPDIHILFQQQCGKGVAEHVGGDVEGDGGQAGIFVDHKADGLVPVSYTHLDVYKRQAGRRSRLFDGLCYGEAVVKRA